MAAFKVKLLKEKTPEVVSEMIRLYYLNSRILHRELTDKKDCLDCKRIVKLMRKDRLERLLARYGSYTHIMRAYKEKSKTMPVGSFVVLRTLESQTHARWASPQL